MFRSTLGHFAGGPKVMNGIEAQCLSANGDYSDLLRLRLELLEVPQHSPTAANPEQQVPFGPPLFPCLCVGHLNLATPQCDPISYVPTVPAGSLSEERFVAKIRFLA